MNSKTQPRWFVILQGDEVNNILTTNFSDVGEPNAIRIKTRNLRKTVDRLALEISHQQMQEFLQYLQDSGRRIKLSVAKRIPETSEFRFAHVSEYSDVARKKYNLKRVVDRQLVKRTRKHAFVRTLKNRSK